MKSFRQRIIPVAVALAVQGGAATHAWGLPVGAQVVHGSATIAQTGTTLNITNSNGAIINWQQFNIDAGQTTRFIQTSASSTVLNRVLASDPSVILGNLTSNGRVWLVNPAGIFVGQGARIDAAAFVASTLNVTNADFLANRMKFDDSLGSVGKLVNQGTITTPMGGSVYLIGSNVSNSGIITTPQGETILAAGSKVELIDSATPGVKVEITGAAGDVTNLGEITAEAGRIGIAGVAVRNSGKLNASSVIEEGGRIFLRATKKIELTASSKVGADGTAGGNITAIARENGQISGELVARGEISAQGNGGAGSGGFIETSAASVDVGGLAVKASSGEWLIDPYDYTIDATAAGTIKGALDAGTSVTIDTTNNTAPGAGVAGVGDITVASAIGKAAGGDASLTLNAHNNINLNADITSTVGQLNMVFNPDLDSAGGGAVVLGTTTLNANGGTINAAGKTVNHSTGTATIDSAITIGTLNLSGGTLTGSGTITIPNAGTFTWGGGTLGGAGILNTVQGSTTHLNGGSTYLGAGRTWNNVSQINFAPTSHYASLDIASGATLNNLSTGVIDLHTSMVSNSISGSGTINNAGSITKTLNGATAQTVSIDPTFNNQVGGSVDVQSGTLLFTKGNTDAVNAPDAGHYSVAAGATLQFAGGVRKITGNVTGAGNLVSLTINYET